MNGIGILIHQATCFFNIRQSFKITFEEKNSRSIIILSEIKWYAYPSCFDFRSRMNIGIYDHGLVSIRLTDADVGPSCYTSRDGPPIATVTSVGRQSVSAAYVNSAI